MDKRFQVFVSSTFKDLQDERQEVIQALLELDCIPSGMELFPAADEDQWTLIKRVIDDCDYYVVIVAGRYGSIGSEGKSYTQMEYEYALLQGKPIIAFLHQSPDILPTNKTEPTPEGRAKLAEFRELVQKKVCKYWQSPEGLGSVVSRSIINLIKQKPGIGWVRANLVPSEITSAEMLRLKNRIEELEKDLAEAQSMSSAAYMNLSQGKDKTTIEFRYQRYEYGSDSVLLEEEWKKSVIEISWDELFAFISPTLEIESSKRAISGILEDRLKTSMLNDINAKEDTPLKEEETFFDISQEAISTILLQFRALGYVESPAWKAQIFGGRTTNDQFWKLTPLGNSKMLNERAIKRKP
jgi:Domain of unknown function (DUF4062)